MLGIKPKNKKIVRAFDDSFREFIDSIPKGSVAADRRLGNYKSRKSGVPLRQNTTPTYNDDKLAKFLISARKMWRELQELKRKLAEKDDEIARINKLLSFQTDKVTAYEAIRVKEGREIAKNFEPRTLKQAIKSYLSDKSGTEADQRYREESIRPWLNKFAETIGENVLVLDVPIEAVKNYLEQKKTERAVNSVKQIATYICSMLEHQSGGLYPLGTIRAWMKSDLKDDVNLNSDWYWLEPAQVESLFEYAKKEDAFGQYWADAMRIQHHLALRPEELILIQSSKVYRDKDGKITHIHVCPLVENDVLIRRLKTAKSKASLPVTTDSVRDAIERRMASGKRLLFPRIPEECGCRKPRWKVAKLDAVRKAGEGKEKKANEIRGKFEDDQKLWREKMWCRFYLERLDAAASKVQIGGVDKIDIKKLDGRTLRRTRGRDIVKATRSIYETAKFMRDDPATVEKHYAELLAMDVNVS